MSKLPPLSWRELVKALAKAGFKIVRQKGSHIILVKDERIVQLYLRFCPRYNCSGSGELGLNRHAEVSVLEIKRHLRRSTVSVHVIGESCLKCSDAYRTRGFLFKVLAAGPRLAAAPDQINCMSELDS